MAMCTSALGNTYFSCCSISENRRKYLKFGQQELFLNNIKIA